MYKICTSVELALGLFPAVPPSPGSRDVGQPLSIYLSMCMNPRYNQEALQLLEYLFSSHQSGPVPHFKKIVFLGNCNILFYIMYQNGRKSLFKFISCVPLLSQAFTNIPQTLKIFQSFLPEINKPKLFISSSFEIKVDKDL